MFSKVLLGANLTIIILVETKRNSFYVIFSSHDLACNVFHCYVMLWPALTWRGQEWAQHVQGQLLHTCIMQIAGPPHVMELLTVSI